MEERRTTLPEIVAANQRREIERGREGERLRVAAGAVAGGMLGCGISYAAGGERMSSLRPYLSAKPPIFRTVALTGGMLVGSTIGAWLVGRVVQQQRDARE